MDLKSQMAQLLAYIVEQMKCTHGGVSFDCVYDFEPLGFEYSFVVSNDLCNENKKLDM